MAKSDNSLIHIHEVVKTYETEAGDFTALNKINLSVGKSEFVGIIGKSGSGKSTLINMLTGIDRSTAGQIVINGTDITKLDEGQMAVWRGKNMGIVFQFFQLLPTLTVIENIMLPMDFCNVYKPNQRSQKALELLGQVDLADQAHKFPSQLSGGQQQRIAIARALANDPPIICADEPTGNLDSKTAEQIFGLFQSLVDSGKTIVMVTHDKDLAKKVSRTILIADGQVIEEYLMSTFSSLAPAKLAWVTEQVETAEFAPGKLIVKEGEVMNYFYVIMNGMVEIVISKNKKEKILGTFGRGKYFGEIELFHDTKSIASARAGKKGVRIGRIKKDVFNQIVHETPVLGKKLRNLASKHWEENKTARK
ncbi:ATP-binding cassette domain-containing protein [Candidatus Beckwithbacteria bacterium]|nr:ATP-binding cassette domain-containing protein [Candidatus Beckwithbacteria bacterium]